MIVQHIIWFLFNFRSKNSKISKISFFLAFFRITKNLPKFVNQNQKKGFPYAEAKQYYIWNHQKF